MGKGSDLRQGYCWAGGEPELLSLWWGEDQAKALPNLCAPGQREVTLGVTTAGQALAISLYLLYLPCAPW